MRARLQDCGKHDFMRTAAVIAALLALGMPMVAAPRAALAQADKAPAATAGPTTPAKPPNAKAQAAKSLAAKTQSAKAKAQQQNAAEARHNGLFVAASHGDVEAQLALAEAYRDGHGAPRDPQIALSWFMLAGTNGVAEAAIEAAKAYERGIGTMRDPVTAGGWWYRAGVLGNREARQHYVDMFTTGKITSLGGIAGAEWVAELADTGDLKANLALGEAFEAGRGVAPDPAKAEARYRQAALLYGDAEARFRLGRTLLARPAAWRVPDDEQWSEKDLKKDQMLGAVWLAAKPANTDKASQLRPGIVEAERWLKAAARQGHAGAQYLLGVSYLGGLELPFDPVSGIAWLEAAAAQNHTDALMALADYAAKGQGFFGKDPVRAWVLYDIAGALGRRDGTEARDLLSKSLTQKQAARARELAEDMRDIKGL
jgi:uncharacterized protein